MAFMAGSPVSQGVTAVVPALMELVHVLAAAATKTSEDAVLRKDNSDRDAQTGEEVLLCAERTNGFFLNIFSSLQCRQ